MATVGPTNLPAFFNTDADFRLWGSTISAALATIGLVKTADTGQINWTTVTKPSLANTVQGYEIWRFDDALQATVPVFIKLEYGSSSNGASTPGMWVTAGSASNGSGTLTGQVGSRGVPNAGGNKTAGATLPTYVSGNSGELFIATNVDSVGSNFGFFMLAERPKDTTDTVTSDGVFFGWGSSGSNFNCQYIPAAGAVPGASSQWSGLNPNLWSRSSSGANVDICPIFIPLGGVWRYSHMCCHKIGDMTAGGTYTTTILGGSHTYMSLDNACGLTINWISAGSMGFSFRWE